MNYLRKKLNTLILHCSSKRCHFIYEKLCTTRYKTKFRIFFQYYFPAGCFVVNLGKQPRFQYSHFPAPLEQDRSPPPLREDGKMRNTWDEVNWAE